MAFKFNPITNRLDLTGTSGGGGGDVNGPGSSTDNAVVRWDGVSGTLIQNSVAILSDAGDLSVNSIDLTIALAATDGGTGQTTYTTGDLLYASSASALSKLSVGTNTQVLTLSGGLPSWQNAPATGVTSVSGTLNRISSTGGTTPVIDIDAAYVGQTSITTLGTIATGTWSATTIAVTKGGTGLTTASQGDLLYGSAANTYSALAKDTNATRYLSNTGTSNNPAWAQINLANGTTGVFAQPSGIQVPITTPGAYPYTTLTSDFVILVDSSAARTITPLGSPTTGQMYRIKDNGGSAATNNITVTPSGKNIDGSASYVMNTNYGSIDIVYNGTQWNVL